MTTSTQSMVKMIHLVISLVSDFMECNQHLFCPFFQITTVEIERAIEKISYSSFYSEMNPSSLIFKKTKNSIKGHLESLFNSWFINGAFPSCLKDITLKPVHKKGSKNIIENYRAVCLLPTIVN